MPTTQRHALLLPLNLLALAITAPACKATVIVGPLPLEQGDPTGAPVEGTGKPSPAPGPGSAPAGWERYDFAVAEPINSDCHGDRYVTYSQAYGKWVGPSCARRPATS